jgi:nitric oxide reductase large subunit
MNILRLIGFVFVLLFFTLTLCLSLQLVTMMSNNLSVTQMNILILVHTFVLGFALVTMIAFILWFDFYLCVTVQKRKPIPCNSYCNLEVGVELKAGVILLQLRLPSSSS